MKKIDALLRLARRGPVRARDLDTLAIPRAYLTRLVRSGLLVRAARGVYRLAEMVDEDGEHASLGVAAARVPRGVICLESALAFHGLTARTQEPVWIMIDTRARSPRVDRPRLVIVRGAGAALTYGVQRIVLVETRLRLRVTSPAKTVADCFRYRRRIGVDVANDALDAFVVQVRRNNRRGREQRDADYSFGELGRAARATRVLSVVRARLSEVAVVDLL